MNTSIVSIKKDQDIRVLVKMVVEDDSLTPEYKTSGASGADLRANEDCVLQPLERKLIKTGVRVGIPQGFEGQVRARSGLSAKKGLTLVNGIGTIDSDYIGEILVSMINLSNEPQEIHKGDRIAQLVIVPIIQALFIPVKNLEDTGRGEGGFGHTGV